MGPIVRHAFETLCTIFEQFASGPMVAVGSPEMQRGLRMDFHARNGREDAEMYRGVRRFSKNFVMMPNVDED